MTNYEIDKTNIAFESGQLSYTNHEVDLYNSGVNQLLSLAASRKHNLFHFRIQDLYEFAGTGYAKMSLLDLPEGWEGNSLEAYRDLRKIDEKEVPLSEMGMFFLRADDIRYDTPNLNLLQRLEDKRIFLENIQDTLDTTDKYELVKRCPNVPSPETYAADNLEETLRGISKLPKNEKGFVLKDRYGYGCGAQVHRIDFNDPQLRTKLADYLEDYKKIIVQEYCQEVEQGDLVVTFFDGELIASMKRIAQNGEWKTNKSLGALEQACKLSPENEAIAKEVVEKFKGCRFASVDMLNSGKVLEINAFPGAEGLYTNYDIIIGEKILNKLEKESIRARYLIAS